MKKTVCLLVALVLTTGSLWLCLVATEDHGQEIAARSMIDIDGAKVAAWSGDLVTKHEGGGSGHDVST